MTHTPPVWSAEQVEAALKAWDAEYDSQPPMAKDRNAFMLAALNAAASIPSSRGAETLETLKKSIRARAEDVASNIIGFTPSEAHSNETQNDFLDYTEIVEEGMGLLLTAMLAASPATPPSTAFQERVAAAHGALFDGDPTDLAERRDRFGEEANEVQQALGQTREAAHQLVDYTYDRPAGEPKTEIGAAALTLASLCVIGGWDMMECAEADLEKLQRPETIARIRAKRATRHGRGPLPGLSPDTILALRSKP